VNKENIQDLVPVFGINGGVLGVVTLTDIETILSITLLFLTCIWTSVKIYKLIRK
jgi:hypothetical protein